MKNLTPLSFIGLEGIQPRNDDGGRWKATAFRKPQRELASFCTVRAMLATLALCAQGHHNWIKKFLESDICIFFNQDAYNWYCLGLVCEIVKLLDF